MTYSKNRYYDGSNPYECEFYVEEEVDGEVFEMVKNAIEHGADEIPQELGVRADGDDGIRCFQIDPIDYLTCEEITELEKMIEEYQNEIA